MGAKDTLWPIPGVKSKTKKNLFYRQDEDMSTWEVEDEKDILKCVGTIVCKMDYHGGDLRGYIAMLVIDTNYRGMRLVLEMQKVGDLAEIVLETEVGNHGALHLYENLGFIRDKRLKRYYLCGSDAFRLKLNVANISKHINNS